MDLSRGDVAVLGDVQLRELEPSDLNPRQTSVQKRNENGADYQEEEEEDEDAHARAYAAGKTVRIVSAAAGGVASFVIGVVFGRQRREGDMA